MPLLSPCDSVSPRVISGQKDRIPKTPREPQSSPTLATVAFQFEARRFPDRVSDATRGQRVAHVARQADGDGMVPSEAPPAR